MSESILDLNDGLSSIKFARVDAVLGGFGPELDPRANDAKVSYVPDA
jgi:hypothetical protein